MLNSVRRRLQIDWLISNLRWLLLLLVVAFSFLDAEHGFQSPNSLYLLILLAIGAGYNLVVTVLLVAHLFPQPFPIITLGVDTFLTVGLVAMSGGFDSPLLFFALFPIITAALRFSALASLIVACCIVIGNFALGFFLQPAPAIHSLFLLDRFADAAILLLAALVSGLTGDQVNRRINEARRQEEKDELRRLRASHQQSRLIFELASTLSATMNYQRVLEAMLDVGEIGLRELEMRNVSLVGIVLLFQADQLAVAASRHLPPRDRSATLRGERGAVAQALSTAEPSMSLDPTQDPELSHFVALHQCKEVMILPLRAGFESFGVTIFGSPVEGIFTPDYQDLLVALCNQGVVALQNAQLYQSLMEEKERIVAVEEDARKKLARDLHDGPTQAVAAIAMRANYTRMLLEKQPEGVSEELMRIEELARRTTKEIRQMLFTLRPLILETQGLRAALEQYIAKRAETDPLPIVLEAPEGVDQVLSKDQQGMIFYIIEEALSNARKHARARTIWVRLRQDRTAFVAEVQDDGVGFDTSVLEKGYEERGSLGMLNMRERAELAGGTWRIQSAPGQGTRVTLRVPFKDQAG